MYQYTNKGCVNALVFIHSTDVSSAADMKCEIRSSCSPSVCQQTNPMTVDPGSNITLNCSTITGELVQGMTWNQTLDRISNGTELSQLVLQQSNSTTSSGKYSCRCSIINFARKCFMFHRLFSHGVTETNNTILINQLHNTFPMTSNK